MRYLYTPFPCIVSVSLIAQTARNYSRIDSLSLDSLHNLEISLEGLGKTMITSTDEQERLTSSYHFCKNVCKSAPH